MLVICVRRKYVTLIYDLPGRGGVFTRAGGGGFYPGGGGGFQFLSKIIQTQNFPIIVII